MKAVPQLLELLAQVDVKSDPRGRQQRYLSVVLFNEREGLLARSLEKEEKDLPPKMMLMQARSVLDAIVAIEASTDSPALIRIPTGENKTHCDQNQKVL